MNKNLFKIDYWTNLSPGSLEPSAQKYFILFILLLVVIIVLISVYLKKVKKGSYLKIWRSLNTFALTNFVISLLLLFFTYENTKFFSARFWFVLWFIGMVVWLKFIYTNSKKIPKLREQRIKKEKHQKYLP